MKKVTAITFHRAQNFGSVLQTYALSKTVSNIKEDILYQVLDVSSNAQKELYSHYKRVRGFSDLVKNAVIFLNSKKITIRENKFKSFLNDNLVLTNDIEADYFISGSDQIWNVRAKDFSDFYFLDFAKNTKKISYAASFGPLKIDWDKYDKEKYTKLLNDYSAISVREEGSRENVELLTGKTCDIHIDPTLLLSADEWRKVQSNANYKNGKYILLYCLEPSKKQLKIAKAISKKLNLPIVVLRYNNKNDIFNTFAKRYDAGPQDFLSYIDNAALVLTSSFHGTAFSLIYGKPFYVLDNANDNRISSILNITGTTDRNIEDISEIEKVDLSKPNVDSINEAINAEKQKSYEYLKGALEIE